MIQLRDYQLEAIRAVSESYTRGIRRPLVGLPTGTGKTVVFSSIVKGAAAKDRRAIIIAHRDELIQQAQDKLVTIAPELALSVGIVKARDHNPGLPVTVASVQSLNARRLERIRLEHGERPFDVVVIDEAHHAAASSYLRVMEAFGCFSDQPPLTIGVTATPQRSDGKDLGDVWEEIVYHRDMLGMMRQGYLCNLRGIAVKLHAFDADKLRTVAGDFVADDAGEALADANAPKHIAGAWLVNAEGRKTIVFTPTVELARDVADEFTRRGVKAAMVSGATPLDERRQLLVDFKAGRVTVIANAQVLTEGFDEPSVECIVVARPTKSQLLYVQMVGRGTRIHPGKADCLVMDVVGVTERLDLTTLPKLFGLGEDDARDELDGEGAGSSVEVEVDVLASDEQRREREAREGRIVATQVELFSRQDLAWQLVRPGLWTLRMGDEAIYLQVDPASARWRAFTMQRRGAPEALADGLDLNMAMGVAEEYARRSPAMAEKLTQALVSKTAKWRGHRATDGQRAAMRRWGIPQWDAAAYPDLSKGEANDLLNIAIAKKEARRAR